MRPRARRLQLGPGFGPLTSAVPKAGSGLQESSGPATDFQQIGSATDPPETPTLVVAGAGFSGATSTPADQGNTANRYGTRVPIARWADPQYQDCSGTKYFCLLADHGSGIQKVSFVLDNGAATDVVSPMTYDGINGYWIGIDTSALADDESRELRAIVYPVDGPCLVMQGNTWTASGVGETNEGVMSMWFATNNGGTLYSASLYVDPVSGNDTTGDGSSGLPYLTTMKALRQHKVNKNAAGKGNNAGGGVILMKAGSFALGTYAFPEVETPDRYVVIKPAPDVTQAQCILTSSGNSSGLRTQRVKLEGLTITPSSTAAPIQSASNPLSQLSHFWLDNCVMDWVSPATAGTAWFSGPRHLALTDCAIRNTVNAVTNPYVKLVRDTLVENLSGDAFSDVGCVVNCEVGNIYVSGATHPDVYQLQQTNNANKFLYGIVATSAIDAQGIFQGGGFTVNGMAIWNCNIVRAVATTWLNFSFGGTLTHVLIRNTTGSDNSTTVPTSNADSLVKNCVNASNGGVLLMAGDTGTLPFTGTHGFRYEA